MSKDKKIQLELQIDAWLQREDEEDEVDFRQGWLKEGIELYEQFKMCRLSNQEKAWTYHSLAEFYLEYGRSEKMIGGNKRRAFSYLQRAASTSAQKGDSFYHLAFLAEAMTPGRERWESAAFYAKEAIERGIDLDKQIKVWCLLGKAYRELGLIDDAAKCFSKSKNLDKDDNHFQFRDKYIKKEKSNMNFIRLNQTGQSISKSSYRDELIDRSKGSRCYVLHFGRRGASLYGNGSIIDLSLKNAEILKLIFESSVGLTKEEIFHNTIGIGKQSRRPESVKTDISRLRLLLKEQLDVKETLIQTIGDRGNQRYIWNPEMEKHVLED
ncbi:tetratricopeptide repeat protein [Sutcliffiella cohnii]|uniref:tetratricopeptide repeat protein n=1 Tax=Sutcliffiella cohnii TaxID=33932 RepID=UPI002E1BBA3D|nr:tetratricopeptide repeat protein [Sutcliffiella cohnii]